MRLEDDVKKALKKRLDALAPVLWYYMPVQNGMGVTGIPDFVCCYRGQFVGIETKKPGRRGEANEGLSGQQVRIKDRILASGGKYFKVDDQETIDDVLFWVNCIEEAVRDAQEAGYECP